MFDGFDEVDIDDNDDDDDDNYDDDDDVNRSGSKSPRRSFSSWASRATWSATGFCLNHPKVRRNHWDW